MRIEPFLLERLQSRWEHHVDFNLSESGVEPLSVRELLSDLPDGVDGLLDSHLAYVQTNGSEELRARIAGLYPGSGPGGVLVTTGGAEANFLVCLRLLSVRNAPLMRTLALWAPAICFISCLSFLSCRYHFKDECKWGKLCPRVILKR